MASKQKGGGSKKIGRNKKWCEVYKTSGRRIKNKRKKLARHLKEHPDDKQTAKVMARI